MPNPDEPARRRHRLTWIAAGILVALLVLVAWRVARKPAPLRFDTATADRGPIVARVTATGVLSAVVTVQVGSQVSGRIARLLTDYNASVTKEQLIAEIDPALFEASVEQARANVLAGEGQLRQAEANALAARRTYDRQKPLRAGNLVAQQDLDTAETNLKAAEAGVVAAKGQLAQARAQLNQAQVNLAYTKIRSPIDGTVISRSVDVGQTVAASLQAPTLFTLAGDLRQMQVDTSVAEADVGKLAPGMEATFVVDAYPDERFKGTIRQIRNAPQTQQNVVTYDAVIDVRNPDLKLRPGMTANVTVVYADRQDVLRVPNAALRFRPTPELLAQLHRSVGGESGRSGGWSGGAVAAPPDRPATRPAPTPGSGRTVWVLRGQLPEPVPVQVGVSDGTLTEISSGALGASDKVVTGVQTDARPAAAPNPAAGPGRRPF